ncbi:GTP cyclohydrolase I FolE [Candidatus Parcubacteria bacterium]|nr:MAG: GTP cyclohydrolase I FolE [Candidatus Parcubacteria bacterium]
MHEEQLKQAAKAIISIGAVNVNSEGLRRTPERFTKMIKDLCEKNAPKITTFPANGYKGIIVSQKIKFYSLCEHHILPFFGYATVGYIPDKRIIGISKLPRIVHYAAKGLNTQEGITVSVAEILTKELKPKGCAVYMVARHLCMEMRGVCEHEAVTSTVTLRGIFEKDNTLALQFIKGVNHG